MKTVELLTGRGDRLSAYVTIGLYTLLIIMLFRTSEATPEITHFPVPATTGAWCEFKGNLTINGGDAQPGDEVAFLDGEGVLCGHAVVLEQFTGRYLFAYVFEDDLFTSLMDEGARSGEELTVKIWDASEDREWVGACVILTGGAPSGDSSTSPVPPIWQNGGDFVLDIRTEPLAADINKDCLIGLKDALLALEIAGGTELPEDISGAADVNTDQRIGLQEVVYILQKIAGIR